MRKTEAALSKIAIEILEEMYDHATPPAKYPTGVDSYEDHFLSAEQQDDIFNRMCKLRKVSKPDRSRMMLTVCDQAPSTVPLYSSKDRIL